MPPFNKNHKQNTDTNVDNDSIDETYIDTEDEMAKGKKPILKIIIVGAIALSVLEVMSSGAISSLFFDKQATTQLSTVSTSTVVDENPGDNELTSTEVSVENQGDTNNSQLESVRVVKPSSLKLTTARTLKEINTNEQLIETIEVLKQAVAANTKRMDSKTRSTDSFRIIQDIVFESIVELHKLTSSEEVSLEDGSIITPKNNGSSYDVTSASDIVTTVEKGTFVIIPSGFVIQNTETTTTYFAFTNPSDITEVTNLYEVSSLHGLRDKTNDEIIVSRVKDIMESQSGTDGVLSTEYINSIVVFNQFGEVSSVKTFKNNDIKNEMTDDLLVDTVRPLSGFDMNTGEKYRIEDGSLYKNDRILKVQGQATDLTLRYAEYQPDKTENPTKVVEVLDSAEVVIKRISTSKIKRVFLSQATVDEIDYIERAGSIYLVSEYGAEELKGLGYIVGKINKGSLKEEKILLQKEEEKFNDLKMFSGKILTGTSGKIYNVEEQYTRVFPDDNFINTDLYYLSSIGSLMTKKDMVVKDSIVTVKNKTKIGGRILSENYIIEITSLNKATIFNKKTKVKKVYLNPRLSFLDEEWIVIHANVLHNHDTENQIINNIEYSKVVQVKPNVFNYYDLNGELINPSNPDFNFNKILVLKEKVTDIEKIEGDAFDYLYRININTGEVTADGVIGKLLLSSSQDDTASLFNSLSKQEILANKSNDTTSKSVYSIGEMLSKHPHLTKVKFKMMNDDELTIVSGSSIIINGKKTTITDGKYNSDLGIFGFNLSKDTDSRVKRSLTGSMNSNRFERTVRLITNESPNYYSSTTTVATLTTGKKVVGIRNPGYGTLWTSVYDELINLKEGNIALTIKPYGNSTAAADQVTINLRDIRVMSKTMTDDMIAQYMKSVQQSIKNKDVPSASVQKEENNVKILEAQLKDINDSLAAMNGKSLSLQTFKMTEAELDEVEKESEKSESVFNFDIGAELSYEVEKSIEVVEGQDSLIYTELNEKYLEDREGNVLSMLNPIVVLKVAGDFNTNKVKFYPVQIVYTDEERQRQIIDIPATSTVMEYKDDSSQEVIDGVPAFYVNQKVSNLGTTVMLSSVQGVVESMTAPDDGFGGALAGLTDPGADQGDAFTEGVASGASEGIQSILDTMKEKTDGKKDLLITTGELKIKSVFVITTEAGVGGR